MAIAAVGTERKGPRSKAQPTKARGQAFGSQRNERRRAEEADRRARILASLKRLVRNLEADRSAWAREAEAFDTGARLTVMTESGSGNASMEEALLYIMEGSGFDWHVALDGGLWTRLTARAARLSKDTGREWTEADIVQLVGEAAEARLRQDPEGTLAWVRARRRAMKPGGRYEVPFDSELAARMQDFADGADVGDAPGIVRAHLRDAAFVDEVLAKIAGSTLAVDPS